MMTNLITIKFNVEGFHNWDEALEQVDYLSNRHRHLFKVTVTMEVVHDDRDIEFHLLRRECVGRYSNQPIEFGSQSCEMMASDLYKYLQETYTDNRKLWVAFSEDGEFSGIKTNFFGGQ